MIKGLGVDIAEIDRIRSITSRFGSRFLNRIFTNNEIEYCKISNNDYRFTSLSARFAAKEAFYKAVFPIVRHFIPWHACEVLNDSEGVPRIKISTELKDELNEPHIQLSLSHSEKYAVAVVIIE
jgi:holo-[acyl-carrier protein] synthase